MAALGLAALFSLASPPSAHAQWVLDPDVSTVSGGASYSYTGPDGTAHSGGWDISDWGDFLYGGYNDMGSGTYFGGGSASAAIDATQTFIFHWAGGGPPPPKASFLVTGLEATSYADTGSEMTYDENFPSGLVAGELGGLTVNDPDDGFGDKPVATTLLDTDPSSIYGPRWGSIQKTSSSPGHLVQKDGSSGIVIISVSGSASASASSSAPAEQQVSDYVEAYIAPVTVTPDGRGVTLSSSLGQTYHKGSDGTPVLNTPDSGGTLTDDTKAPRPNGYDALPVSYVAIPLPQLSAWGVNSAFAWSNKDSSMVVSSPLAGTFNPNVIPALQVKYQNLGTDSSATPSHSDVVQVVLQDSADGAKASATAALNFHSEYENLLVTVDQTKYGDWQRVTPVVNPGANGGSIVQVTQSVSVTSSTSAQGALADTVSGTFGVPLGQTYTSSVPRPVNFNIPPNQWSWVEDQPFWEHREGTADNYEMQGYTGMVPWTLDSAINGQPLIDFREKVVSSDTDPGV